jgi:hypothetical protein
MLKLLLLVLLAIPAVWFFRDLRKTKKNWRELRRAEERNADK